MIDSKKLFSNGNTQYSTAKKIFWNFCLFCSSLKKFKTHISIIVKMITNEFERYAVETAGKIFPLYL